MPIIEWNIGFVIGVQEIDKHHQQLIHLLNETYDVFRNGEIIENDIVEGLLDYTCDIFAYEENLMKSTSFPGLQKHKEEHETFISRAAEFKSTLTKHKNISIEILWFLCNWVTHHLRETDIELGHHMDVYNIRQRMNREAV